MRGRRVPWSKLALAIQLLLLGACSTCYWQPQSPLRHDPALYEATATMTDGYVLPLHRWGPADKPRAVVLALHGFNDYGKACATLGEYLAGDSVLTVAYDQRGFGATSYPGRWPGVPRLVDDLATMTSLLKNRYSGTPLFVFGESMGGALALTAQARGRLTQVAGLILSAPAVWGRQTMDPIMRAGLWIVANTMPAHKVTGEGLKIMASDNRAMLLALSRDPLVIKRTRLDAISGLTDLMDAGLNAAGDIDIPTLLLYGERDQVVPKQPVCRLLQALDSDPRAQWQFVGYRNGYHMLTRDLQRQHVMADIRAWIRRREDSAGMLERQGKPPSWCQSLPSLKGRRAAGSAGLSEPSPAPEAGDAVPILQRARPLPDKR